MIPRKYAHITFGFFLSGLMSLLVSGISTVRTTGVVEGLFQNWMEAWLLSWAVAFPAVLIVAPFAKRLVALVTFD